MLTRISHFFVYSILYIICIIISNFAKYDGYTKAPNVQLQNCLASAGEEGDA